MKTQLLKSTNWIYGLILGLLGFSGCAGNNTEEYGMPNATYIISGKVTNQQNSPIKNIEIILQQKEWGDDDKYTTVEKTMSDENGDFNIKYNNSPTEKFKINYHDTDGIENGGEFENMTQGLEFKSDEYTGGSGSWYKGEAKRTVNAVLTPKKPQAE